MDKRWTLAIVTLLMVLLIYSFLSMVLKTDKKKPAHSRMYRDYSNYSKKSSTEDDVYAEDRRTYASSVRATKLKRTLFKNTVKKACYSYNRYMGVALKNSADDQNDNNTSDAPTNPQYKQIIELSKIYLPELQNALVLYREGDFEEAISKLDTALEKLDPLEMKKRIEIYSLLAECYIKLNNEDGYIQNKIRQVRIQRKYQKLLRETFPDYPDNDFMTTQEASTNLIRIRSTVAKLPDSPMVREMVKKAELDLEVARKVAQ